MVTERLYEKPYFPPYFVGFAGFERVKSELRN